MREIKFRAWDNKDKCMRYSDEEEPFYDFIHFLKVCQLVDMLENLMQYTGLKDKNGKEIYEGDIVVSTTFKSGRRFECKAIVRYDPPSFVISLDDKLTTPIQPSIEVIGNIYENSELLKEVK